MRDEMNENQFKIWYKADWPDETENQLFTMRALKKMFASLTVEEKKILNETPDEKRLGVDVARFGNDLTVLYKAVRFKETWFLTDSKYFSKQDTMKTVGEIINWHRKEEFDLIQIDDAGLGGGVTDRLKEVSETNNVVKAFIAAEKPDFNVKNYLNKKAQSYHGFSRRAEKGLVRVCDFNAVKLKKQLELLLYEFTSSGQMKIIDNQDKSPDFADASNIALFEGRKLLFGFA